MPKPCQHAETEPDCQSCFLYANSSLYRAAADSPVDRPKRQAVFRASEPKPKVTSRRICLHRGESELDGPARQANGLSHTRSWYTCAKGHGQVAGYVCECKPFPSGCRNCPDRAVNVPKVEKPPPLPPIRHLLYFIWPRTGNGVWQMNLDRLKERYHLFNGRRVFYVATSENAAEPSEVRDYLGDAEAEFIAAPNNPGLREVAAWDSFWSRLEDKIGENDFTFFAHAKGVTKENNPGVMVHQWADVMYRANLDYWPVVADVLASHPLAGAFKKIGRGFGPRSDWHYSGTFYWVRNRDWYAKDWRGLVDRTWWGTESYPGVAFSQSEGGVTFGRGIVPRLNLYVSSTWERIRPEWEKWQRENTGMRTTFPSSTGPQISSENLAQA